MTIIPFPANRCGSPRRGLATMTVAPRPVARLRYGNPSQPPAALAPASAVTALARMAAQGLKITGVAIDGPGEPLATPETTLETLALVRQDHPELPLELVTLGMGGAGLVEALAAQGLEAITLVVNAAVPTTLAKIYSWIRPGNRTIAIGESAQILLSEQARTILAAKEAGLQIHIRTTLYPGINDGEIEMIGQQMAKLGSDSMTVAPWSPGPEDEDVLAIPDEKSLQEAQRQASVWVPPRPPEARLAPHHADPGTTLPRPSGQRPNLALVSSNGLEVDLHLGEAIYVLVYGPREDGLPCLLGTRPAPEPGGGKNRWHQLAETLSDCFVLLTASAGDTPRRLLQEQGVNVLITEGEVEGLVDTFFGGGKKKRKRN